MDCAAFTNLPKFAAMSSSDNSDILDMLHEAETAKLLNLLDDGGSLSAFFDPEIDALLLGNGADDDDNVFVSIPTLMAEDSGDDELASVFATPTMASAPTSTVTSPSASPLQRPPGSMVALLGTMKTPEPSATHVEESTKKKKSTFQRQKEELMALRASVATLEVELRAVKDSVAAQAGAIDRAQQHSRNALLWQGLAVRQQKARSRAEQENTDLRRLVREQTSLARSLERAMRKRLVRVLPVCFVSAA